MNISFWIIKVKLTHHIPFHSQYGLICQCIVIIRFLQNIKTNKQVISRRCKYIKCALEVYVYIKSWVKNCCLDLTSSNWLVADICFVWYLSSVSLVWTVIKFQCTKYIFKIKSDWLNFFKKIFNQSAIIFLITYNNFMLMAQLRCKRSTK